MKAITVDTSKERFIVSIDKSLINKELLMRFVDNLRIEFLAQKVNFSEDIEVLGEQIKADWWAKNKDRFIPKEEQ